MDAQKNKILTVEGVKPAMWVKALKDESVFNSVTISFDTVEWANKADIDPETLYEDGKPYGK